MVGDAQTFMFRRRIKVSVWGEDLKLMSYGDEQGDRSTPLFVYWLIYQSDQLEEVGMYGKRDSKNPCTGREERGGIW